MLPRIVFLVGPTAAGKTSLAIKIAQKLDAEIISCDSMQVYKGMEILSSQPKRSELIKITHHLLAQVSPEKEFNVSRYRSLALKKIKEVHKKGKLPLFVGGSGLYMSVVIDGIFKIKAENKGIREKLYYQANKKGSLYLHQRLGKIDWRAASKIHPNDTKRIVRALEVFEVSGKPISELQATRTGLENKYDIKILGLDISRVELDQKINKRVDQMFRHGLVKEVKKLLSLKLSRTSRYAIGINEVKGYLDGLYSLDDAKELIKKNTRQYARRQMTWFRKDERIKWLNNAGTVPPELLELQRIKRKRS
jgi:tRNA dimethylallyltransferase